MIARFGAIDGIGWHLQRFKRRAENCKSFMRGRIDCINE